MKRAYWQFMISINNVKIITLKIKERHAENEIRKEKI
jgi:hypothetical protein